MKTEKGPYKMSVTQDVRITKAILLLAIGMNSRKQLIKNEINSISAYAWDKKKNKTKKTTPGYKDRLLEVSFIRKGEKEGKYNFNWDIMIDSFFNIIKTDISQNFKEIEKAHMRINKKYKQLKERFEKRRTGYKKIKKETEEQKLATNSLVTQYGNELREIRIKLFRLGLLLEEYDRFEKQASDYLKNLDEVISFFKKKQNHKNWLICQHIEYFKDLLYSKAEFKSLEEEIRTWLSAIAYNKRMTTTLPPEMRKYPFDYEKIDHDKFIELILKYKYYSDLKLEWLVCIKPEKIKEEQRMLEQYEKQREKYEQKLAEKHLQEFYEEFEKAKTLENQYAVLCDYYGEKDADNWLNEQLIKKISKKRI